MPIGIRGAGEALALNSNARPHRGGTVWGRSVEPAHRLNETHVFLDEVLVAGDVLGGPV
jgi:hypothetical protein